VPLSGPITDIPEFHDCQRFIVQIRGREVYDSLYAIYASDSLAFVDTLLDTLSALPDDTAAIAAATIYSYGGVYPRLGIQPGFNCLYLSRQDTNWGAWMVPKGIRDPNCSRYDQSIEDEPGVTKLRVNAVRTHAADNDYPPVARWDWDSAGQDQYIGIKCGAAWCEVSDDGTASPQPSVSIQFGLAYTGEFPGPQGTERSRVTGVKGWYDAQRLAHRGEDGRLVPSNAWGIVVPHPTLPGKQRSEFRPGRWVHVATAMVRNADYEGAVLQMRRDRPYEIRVCSRNCFGGNAAPATCDTPAGATREWSMITYRNDAGKPDTVYHCLARRAHAAPPDVPGTARWRWLANDETTWKRCGPGCCELQ
jgi:hypothetical protein